MPRRDRARPAAPAEVLRIYPQRDVTGVVLGLAGVGVFALCCYSAVTKPESLSFRVVIGFAGGFGLALAFMAIGVHTWTSGREFVRTDAHLEIVEHSLRGPGARRTLARRQITDVIVETDDGAARIVIVLRDGQVPLTTTFTTDDLRGRADQLRRFLELPADEPVRVLPRRDEPPPPEP